jgi:hypothetical protein
MLRGGEKRCARKPRPVQGVECGFSLGLTRLGRQREEGHGHRFSCFGFRSPQELQKRLAEYVKKISEHTSGD